MRGIFEIVRARHSCRVPFDPKRCVSEQDLLQILEAARWAPTAQNICRISEIIAIDDKAALAAISTVAPHHQRPFIRENHAQLSFSAGELMQKKTGSWRLCFQFLADSECKTGEYR